MCLGIVEMLEEKLRKKVSKPYVYRNQPTFSGFLIMVRYVCLRRVIVLEVGDGFR